MERGSGGAGGGIGSLGSSFGLRLQTQIEIPPHVQPVVLIRAMHSLSPPAEPMLLFQLTVEFFSFIFVCCMPVYISVTFFMSY